MAGEQSHENQAPSPSSVSEREDLHISTQKHGPLVIQIQGFSCRPHIAPNIVPFQKHFQALDDDIIVASKPKCGTTWLKALIFSIVNRTRFPLSDSPLNSAIPQKLVSSFEIVLYAQGQIPDLTSIPSPRLFGTHLPFAALAESIKQGKSRIIYITRNPLDAIVSFWYWNRAITQCPDWPLEECIEMFCRGEETFGPFWDHALGYWKQSLEKPHKVLFLRYEQLKENPTLQMKRIAAFVGLPFSAEEESAGSIEEITKFCSLSNMKDVASKETGRFGKLQIQPKNHFRKGEVGDHINHLSPSAIERFSKILEEKLKGSGLSYDLPC